MEMESVSCKVEPVDPDEQSNIHIEPVCKVEPADVPTDLEIEVRPDSTAMCAVVKVESVSCKVEPDVYAERHVELMCKAETEELGIPEDVEVDVQSAQSEIYAAQAVSKLQKKRGRPLGSKAKKARTATTISTSVLHPTSNKLQSTSSLTQPTETKASASGLFTVPNVDDDTVSVMGKAGDLFVRRQELSDEDPIMREMENTEGRRNDFTDDAVKCLVREVVARQKKAYKKSLVSKMYAEIANLLVERGFTVTAQGCRHKYNKLLDRYKRVKDHNSKTGRDPMIFKYEAIFDEVMGEDRADINVQTMDSSINVVTEGRRRRPLGHLVGSSSRDELQQCVIEIEREKLEVMKERIAIARERLECENKEADERWEKEKKRMEYEEKIAEKRLESEKKRMEYERRIAEEKWQTEKKIMQERWELEKKNS